jgi:hypothetical protein
MGMLLLALELLQLRHIKGIKEGGGRDHNWQGNWRDGTRGHRKGLDDGAQGTKGQVGLREFLWEVLGVLRDIKLCPQGEESGHDHLKALERRVFTVSKVSKKGIHITGVNKGVLDEGRDHLHIGVDGGLEGSKVVILDFEVALGSVGSSGREFPITKSLFIWILGIHW